MKCQPIFIACGLLALAASAYIVIMGRHPLPPVHDDSSDQRRAISDIVLLLEAKYAQTGVDDDLIKSGNGSIRFGGQALWQRLYLADCEDVAKLQEKRGLCIEHLWKAVSTKGYDGRDVAPVIFQDGDRLIVAIMPMSFAEFYQMVSIHAEDEFRVDEFKRACSKNARVRDKICGFDFRAGGFRLIDTASVFAP